VLSIDVTVCQMTPAMVSRVCAREIKEWVDSE